MTRIGMGLVMAIGLVFTLLPAHASFQVDLWLPGTNVADMAPSVACLKDGTTLVPAGNIALGVFATGNGACPPATNSAVGNDCISTASGTSGTTMGHDWVMADGYFGPNDGVVSQGIEYKNRPGYAYLRIFSAKTLAGSAYYGDSVVYKIQDTMAPIEEAVANVVCSKVNPGYVIPMTEEGPAELTAHPGAVPLAGTITVGVGNNLLGAEGMQVVWTNTTTSANGTFMVTATGEWSGNVIVVAQASGGANSIDVYALGTSARPGFPRSKVVTKTITVLAK